MRLKAVPRAVNDQRGENVQLQLRRNCDRRPIRAFQVLTENVSGVFDVVAAFSRFD